MSAPNSMASRMRRSDKHIKGINTSSPTRKPASVNDWFDNLGLTEYSHLFAGYRSMQVSTGHAAGRSKKRRDDGTDDGTVNLADRGSASRYI